jgi:hypothetical protein
MKQSLAKIRDLWEKSPSSDMNPGGSWIEELEYYFNTGIFLTGLRLDILAKTIEKGSLSETTGKCSSECSDMKKELAVCSAVANALFELLKEGYPASQTAIN